MGSDSETEKSAQKEREKKKLLALAPIAKPLAGKKLCKRTLKLVRRAAEHKCLKRGVKEVVKSIRRGNKGWVDFLDLANAGATKRPTCCVLVLTKPAKGELGQEEQEKLKGEYDQVSSDISELANSMDVLKSHTAYLQDDVVGYSILKGCLI
ncbi:hypothetical protein DH2020_044288 [Rehmannia glutinosa]|uniref:H/ACA ribonucleoprotein complex subunit 2 n=1 Tax=Rehmannia glutinosa TaxID=99300 RepID=A0ABR0UHE1_REHGL